MDDKRLLLCSVDLEPLTDKDREMIWRGAVHFAANDEQALWFTIDAAEDPSKQPSPELSPLLHRLFSVPLMDNKYRRLNEVDEAVVQVGTKVTSLNLFSNQGWVAGTSDWGSTVDVLFRQVVWQAFLLEIEEFLSHGAYHTVEAQTRPPMRKNP